jgi:hypothetical protein
MGLSSSQIDTDVMARDGQHESRWLWIMPPLLALVMHLPAFWGDLVWDDQLIINDELSNHATLGDVFEPPARSATGPRYFYRPVVALSYMFDRRLFGTAATLGPHVANVIFHTVTVFFVWLLARRLMRPLVHGNLGALVAGTLFAVHPINTESVNWLSGRTDLLATMFMLPGTLLAIRWRDSNAIWALAGSSALILLALMAKEVAVSSLLIVPALLIACPRRIVFTQQADGAVNSGRRQDRLADRVGWLMLGAGYLAAVWIYIGLRTVAGGMSFDHLSLGWIESLDMLVRATSLYLVKVFFPWPQSNILSWSMAYGAGLSIAIGLCGIVLLVLGARRSKPVSAALIILSAFWFCVTLAPALYIAISPLSWTPLAERYLYLPSIGLALLAGTLFCEALSQGRRRIAVVTTSVLVIVFSVSTIERGIVWQTNLNLWSDATEKTRGQAMPWNELGIAYLRLNEDDKALEALLHSLQVEEISLSHAAATANIGQIYLRRGELQKAEQYFKASLDAGEEWPYAHWHMGLVLAAIARQFAASNSGTDERNLTIARAVEYYKTALNKGSDLHQARGQLAGLLTHYGELLESEGQSFAANAQFDSALAEIDTLLAKDPKSSTSSEIRMLREHLRSKLASYR